MERIREQDELIKAKDNNVQLLANYVHDDSRHPDEPIPFATFFTHRHEKLRV